LAAHGLAEALFEEVGRQLDAKGLIVRKGTLIDATLLEAAVKLKFDSFDGACGREMADFCGFLGAWGENWPEM